jgi:hypothetical protein
MRAWSSHLFWTAWSLAALLYWKHQLPSYPPNHQVYIHIPCLVLQLFMFWILSWFLCGITNMTIDILLSKFSSETCWTGNPKFVSRSPCKNAPFRSRYDSQSLRSEWTLALQFLWNLNLLEMQHESCNLHRINWGSLIHFGFLQATVLWVFVVGYEIEVM